MGVSSRQYHGCSTILILEGCFPCLELNSFSVGIKSSEQTGWLFTIDEDVSCGFAG